MKRALLALLALSLAACEEKKPAADAGPTAATPASPAGDAGTLVTLLEDGGVAPAPRLGGPEAPARTAAEEQVYQLPWRSEIIRKVFDLRLPLPGTALLITEEVDSPVKRYRERRAVMSFFIERRGLRGMPQSVPLEEAARWYAMLYQAYDLEGPTEAVFAGYPAVRLDFKSQQDEEELHVALFVVFRGGYLYGVGIESTLPKRVQAAAARIAANSKFEGPEPVVEVGKAKTLGDLSVKLPGARELVEARALGGINLTDRDTRFNLHVSRVPERDAGWVKDKKGLQEALESQRFPEFTLASIRPTTVGGQKGFVAAYSTSGKHKEEKVFLLQHVVRAFGYAYIFTASADARYEQPLRAWAAKVLKGAKFERPF